MKILFCLECGARMVVTQTESIGQFGLQILIGKRCNTCKEKIGQLENVLARDFCDRNHMGIPWVVDAKEDQFTCPNCKQDATDEQPCKCGRTPSGEDEQTRHPHKYATSKREHNRRKRARKRNA